MGTRVQDRKYIKILLYLRKGKIKHEKSRKKSKINIARLLLFISVIILWILGNNIYSNVRRFSWAEIAKANFYKQNHIKVQ